MRWDIGVNSWNYLPERKEIEQTLKPCPFCGNEEIEFSLIHPQYYGKPNINYWCYWEILCPECGCNFENGIVDEDVSYADEDPDKRAEKWEQAKQEIIEMWNRRTEA